METRIFYPRLYLAAKICFVLALVSLLVLSFSQDIKEIIEIVVKQNRIFFWIVVFIPIGLLLLGVYLMDKASKYSWRGKINPK